MSHFNYGTKPCSWRTRAPGHFVQVARVDNSLRRNKAGLFAAPSNLRTAVCSRAGPRTTTSQPVAAVQMSFALDLTEIRAGSRAVLSVPKQKTSRSGGAVEAQEAGAIPMRPLVRAVICHFAKWARYVLLPFARGPRQGDATLPRGPLLRGGTFRPERTRGRCAFVIR